MRKQSIYIPNNNFEPSQCANFAKNIFHIDRSTKKACVKINHALIPVINYL